MVDTVININDGFVSITAVGGETELDFDFPIYSKSHLRIIRTRAAVEEDLVLDTDYTIANDQLEVSAGGTAVLIGSATPAVAGDVYTLLLNVPEARTVDFSQAGDFFAATLNKELDLLTQISQQLRRDVDKSIRVSDTSTVSDLSVPDAEANKIIGWNSAGTALENKTPNSDTYLSISAYMNTVIDDTTPAEAKVTLDVLTQSRATSAGPSTIEFAEDTDNGTNKVTLTSAASLAADYTVTLPSSTNTLSTLAGTEALTNKSVNGVTLTTGGSATQYLNGAGTYTAVASPFTLSFTSSNQTITSAGPLTLAHSLGVTPKLVSFELVCVTGEAGYTAADVVPIPPTGFNTGGSGTACVFNATNVLVRFGNSASAFNIPNFSSGASANLTNGNWQLRVKAWA